MATFLTGHTFGATEQVTNTKLGNIVNNASISGINFSELGNSISAFTTNASLIDVSSVKTINLHYSTYGSLATFINAKTGWPFTLIAQQASFPAIVDTGSFKLASNWIPAKQYDNITLVWNGTAFVEVCRVVT